MYKFTGIHTYAYWSSTTVSEINSARAWYVFLDIGYAGYDYKSCHCYVWPVRAGQ